MEPPDNGHLDGLQVDTHTHKDNIIVPLDLIIFTEELLLKLT